MNERFRLVTRSDFDGLVCAVLLRHLKLTDQITFVHPKDMQDGKIEISAHDITTNLPYVPGAHLVFDHHESEMIRNDTSAENYIIDADAPSAARVVWRHYGGHDVFPNAWDDMMVAVDKADSAQYSRAEVLEPESWELLNLLMDSRTGLGRFRDFRISNYALMMELVEHCRTDTIEEILDLPDVAERVELWQSYRDAFAEQLRRCSTVHGKLVVLDLTEEEIIYPGSRFMIYALFPDCDISIHKMWGFRKEKIVFATGKSIFDRGNTTHVGKLMLEYGGGGHAAAGTCQVPEEEADATLESLIRRIENDSAAAGRLPIAEAS